MAKVHLVALSWKAKRLTVLVDFTCLAWSVPHSRPSKMLCGCRAEELHRVSATLKMTRVQNDVLNRALCR